MIQGPFCIKRFRFEELVSICERSFYTYDLLLVRSKISTYIFADQLIMIIAMNAEKEVQGSKFIRPIKKDRLTIDITRITAILILFEIIIYNYENKLFAE